MKINTFTDNPFPKLYTLLILLTIDVCVNSFYDFEGIDKAKESSTIVIIALGGFSNKLSDRSKSIDILYLFPVDMVHPLHSTWSFWTDFWEIQIFYSLVSL